MAKPLQALCFSKNAQGIELAATLAQLLPSADGTQIWFSVFGHLSITLALIPPGQADKKKIEDSVLAMTAKTLGRIIRQNGINLHATTIQSKTAIRNITDAIGCGCRVVIPTFLNGRENSQVFCSFFSFS